jgi:hypothetical protein
MEKERAGGAGMRRLVRLLYGLQLKEGLSNKGMAWRLGISRSMWIMVCQGKRLPGPKFLGGVLRAYPDLEPDVQHYLLEEGYGPPDGR